MEREGLSRALDFLTLNSLEVGTLITDRHKQINKFVSTQYPDIDHRYDVWHISKGYGLVVLHERLNFNLVNRNKEEAHEVSPVQGL